MLDQRRDVGETIAQRRHTQHMHVQPIEQVLAEPSLRQLLLEIAMGRCDDARVDSDRLVRADAGDFALLEHAQELGLGGGRQIADLVQKQRAAAGGFERPLPRGGGTGERAALVAEQLAFHQLVRQRRAIERDEWALGAGA